MFLKPGNYMSALENRFVQVHDIEPCLVIEAMRNQVRDVTAQRYVVLVGDEQLVAWGYNLSEREAVPESVQHFLSA